MASRAKVRRRVAVERTSNSIYAVEFAWFVLNSNSKMFAVALNNEFGFGKMRLERLLERANEMYRQYITRSALTWDSAAIRHDKRAALEFVRKLMHAGAQMVFEALEDLYGFGAKRFLRLKDAVNEIYKEYMVEGECDWEYADAILDRRVKQIMGEE